MPAGRRVKPCPRSVVMIAWDGISLGTCRSFSVCIVFVFCVLAWWCDQRPSRSRDGWSLDTGDPLTVDHRIWQWGKDAIKPLVWTEIHCIRKERKQSPFERFKSKFLRMVEPRLWCWSDGCQLIWSPRRCFQPDLDTWTHTWHTDNINSTLRRKKHSKRSVQQCSIYYIAFLRVNTLLSISIELFNQVVRNLAPPFILD